MIAVSSFKPNATEEVKRNEFEALQSWATVFEEWVFSNDKPGFSDPPTIRSLAKLCATFPSWSCIINADIIVHPELERIISEIDAKGGCCAVSKRYEFYPDNPSFGPRLKDLGLDIFCGKPEVWQSVAANIPEELILGHIMWDTWMLAWLYEHFTRSFYDFTPSVAIFHPKHGGRGDQSMNRNLTSVEARYMRMPHLKITTRLPIWNPIRNFVTSATL